MWRAQPELRQTQRAWMWKKGGWGREGQPERSKGEARARESPSRSTPKTHPFAARLWYPKDILKMADFKESSWETQCVLTVKRTLSSPSDTPLLSHVDARGHENKTPRSVWSDWNTEARPCWLSYDTAIGRRWAPSDCCVPLSVMVWNGIYFLVCIFVCRVWDTQTEIIRFKVLLVSLWMIAL